MDVEYLLSKWSVNKSGTVYILEDEMVDAMAIANNVWAVFGIVVFYLVFVAKLGPVLMESQKPFNVKRLMMCYNLFQVGYNAWLVYLFFAQGAPLYLRDNLCHPPAINPRRIEFVAGIYYYFISKIIDLMDTVFMVLRKKGHQISTLQIYHHTTMVISVWITLKYIRDQAGLALGVLNSAIHIVMYSYYYLTCLGPAVQRFLWWKKYLTLIQIGQFMFGIVFIGGLKISGCDVHVFYSFMWILNLVAMLVLFTKYYQQTYSRKKEQKTN